MVLANKTTMILSLLLLLGAVAVEANDFELADLGKPNSTSCFQYDDPPSCYDNATGIIIMDPLKINKVCEWLVYDYIYLEEITWGDWDSKDFQRLQVDAMSGLQQEQCNEAKEAWSHCYFCLSPEDPAYERKGSWCWLESDVCIPPSQPGSLVPTPDHRNATEIQEACDLLEVVMTDLAFPQTVEYCHLAESTLYACEWYCIDGHRNPKYYAEPTNESCWTFEDPPLCPPPYNENKHPLPTNESIDLEYECKRLREQMDDRWFLANPWTHVYSLSHIAKNTTECDIARQVYPHCMWCHPLAEGNEDWCLDHHACVDAGGRKPKVKDPNINLQEACDVLEPIYTRLDRAETARLCYMAEMSLHSCPWRCEQPYLGADTQAKKRTLIALARTSSVLSLLGAAYVLYDTLLKKQQPNGSSTQQQQQHQRKTVYHQLLAAVAVFDVVSALAWMFSTTPLPQDEAFNIYGAAGNQASCRTQAFFIQLGFTSIFYNSVLALYYVLVVVYSWKEAALQKIRYYLHAVPLVLGIGLALAVIPFADWTGYGCHIVPYPDDARWKALVFVVIPLGVSVLAITVSMAFVYYKVRLNAQKSSKWSLSGGGKGLQSQVFWQALLYSLSFYVTWPIMFAVYAGSVDYKADTYALTATVSFVAPLQGFTNFLVYIRPGMMRYWKSRRDEKAKQQSTPNGPAEAFAEGRNPAISHRRRGSFLSRLSQSFTSFRSTRSLGGSDRRGGSAKLDEASSQHNRNSAQPQVALVNPESVAFSSNVSSMALESEEHCSSVVKDDDDDELTREIEALEAKIRQYEGMDPSALIVLINDNIDILDTENNSLSKVEEEEGNQEGKPEEPGVANVDDCSAGDSEDLSC